MNARTCPAIAGRTGASSSTRSRNARSAVEQQRCRSAARAGSFASSQGFSASTYWLTASASCITSRIALPYSRCS